MAEYIEREALMEQLQKKKYKVARERYNEGFNDAILKVRSMVHSAPTADVAEVRHGKWVNDICSVCGRVNPTITDDFCGNYMSKQLAYCPNCDAKMEIGDE